MELAQSKTSNTEKESELLSAQSWINYYKRSWEEIPKWTGLRRVAFQACQRSEQSKLARTRSAKRLGLAQSGKRGASELTGVLALVVWVGFKVHEATSAHALGQGFLEPDDLP
ncbi:hypothetical protein AK812_SmicGene45711, partial [Symbiodinium microadriaticum]